VGVGSVLVGFAGVVLVADPWVGGSPPPWSAIVELLVGAVSWAVGTVLMQRWFRGEEMQEANLYQLLGGSVALVGASLVLEPGLPTLSLPLLGILLWLGGVGTAFAYSVWFWLLSRRRAAPLSANLFLVPVVALTASAVLFGERLSWFQYVGVAAVLVSIYLTNRNAEPLEEPAG